MAAPALLDRAGCAAQALAAKAWAEVRLTVNDLLNQDTDLSRTVTGTYVEDVQTDALGRYVMLNLTYRLGRFGG